LSELRARARAMRGALTPGEAVMWTLLRTPPLKEWHWRRQVVFEPYYIADFASYGARVVVEVDGGSHALTGAADAGRTAWFEGQGFRVVRVWNHELLRDREGVFRGHCGAVGV